MFNIDIGTFVLEHPGLTAGGLGIGFALAVYTASEAYSFYRSYRVMRSVKKELKEYYMGHHQIIEHEKVENTLERNLKE